MSKVVCAVCSKEIKPVSFGEGLVWVCCGKVAHSMSRADETKHKLAGSDSMIKEAKT